MTAIPIVIDALCTVTEGLLEKLKDLGIREQVGALETTTC